MTAAAPRYTRLLPWLAMAIAVAVGAASMRNGFAYDDLPLIVDNSRVTTLAAPWDYLGQSYWPAGGLYRPLTVWLLALQWHLGGGSPALFHATSVALHAFVTGLTWLLARRALSPGWAGFAAILFAVHPVHVEAVANVVGQSELLCAALVLASVLLALRGVADGFTVARRLGVIVFGMLAAISKEQGFITPVLVLAACGIAGASPGRAALRRAMPVVAVLSVLLGALLLFRAAVLGGMAGDTPAAPLQSLSTSGRMLVALGTVPQWTRLLLWPARLSFDYSPPGYPVTGTPDSMHVIALVLLAVAAALAWSSRARIPAIALGVVWTAVALLPVSNLIVPTGILLAERTLYLPSIGVVLVLAGIADRVSRRVMSPVLRKVALAAVATLVVLAGARSVSRAGVWKDNDTLLQQVELEAPRNYRAHRTLAQHLDRRGSLDEAAAAYRQSIALWGHDPKVYEDLAILLDREGRDTEAMTVLNDGLAIEAAAPTMRSKLYYLQVGQGDWLAARATATAGLGQGDTMFAALVRRADSALSVERP